MLLSGIYHWSYLNWITWLCFFLVVLSLFNTSQHCDWRYRRDVGLRAWLVAHSIFPLFCLWSAQKLEKTFLFRLKCELCLRLHCVSLFSGPLPLVVCHSLKEMSCVQRKALQHIISRFAILSSLCFLPGRRQPSELYNLNSKRGPTWILMPFP